jgi:hypothetical protein
MKRSTTTRGIISGVLILCLLVSLSVPFTAAANPWDNATNVATKERFIPVELWTGAEWDGKQDLKMAKVDGNYRHNKAAYSIKGPTDWKHTATGQNHAVYERINPQRGGAKMATVRH